MENIKISISSKIKEVAPSLRVGVIQAQVEVAEKSESLWTEIDQYVDDFSLEMPELAKMSQISEARKVYRALGKDPTRYRLSSDSLMRRIVKGQGLYQVNNIVDLNNLLSLQSGHSIGTYDSDKISGSVTYDVGTAEDVYVGIGRGNLNIDGLPVFKDDIGCFGSATSDSERSMVTENTKTILMNIIAFDGDDKLQTWMDEATRLLEIHAGGHSFKCSIVY